MQKILVSSLLAVLLVPGTSAFAQFKNLAKTAKNLAELERDVSVATVFPFHWFRHLPIAKAIPPGIVKGNAVDLIAAKYGKVTPANQSYITRLNTLYEQHLEQVKQHVTSKKYLSPSGFRWNVARDWAAQAQGFYADATKLAQDLDAFYQGESPVGKGADGRRVKLYWLPVDGILYKPIGYSTPVVLNSQEYFVIYDLKSQTGQIAKNNPKIYNQFTFDIYEEIWQAMDVPKKFETFDSLCDAVLRVHFYKMYIDQWRAAGSQDAIKELVPFFRRLVWENSHRKNTLLQYLQQLPCVRQVSNGLTAHLVELPVENLTWVNGATYNPKQHIMLVFESGSMDIYPRADVNNPELFEFIKK